MLFDPNPLTNSLTSALIGLQGDDLIHSSRKEEQKSQTKLVCFAEGRKKPNKTALAMGKLKTELSTTKGRDLRIKNSSSGKARERSHSGPT